MVRKALLAIILPFIFPYSFMLKCRPTLLNELLN